MQFFRNLRLAVRLAIGFGTLDVGLLLVGVVAISAMGGLNSKTDELGAHDLRATNLAGDLAERNATIGHLVAQHLYVHDGDIKTQDALQKRMESLSAENTKGADALKKLLAGGPEADELNKFAQARDAFRASWQEAVKRSRQETIAGDEERDGSRNLYTDEVAPNA